MLDVKQMVAENTKLNFNEKHVLLSCRLIFHRGLMGHSAVEPQSSHK